MLFDVNSVLLEDISKQIKETNGDALGACFVAQADYLRVYSQYCSNQAHARAFVSKIAKSNSRFRAFQEVGLLLLLPPPLVSPS